MFSQFLGIPLEIGLILQPVINDDAKENVSSDFSKRPQLMEKIF